MTEALRHILFKLKPFLQGDSVADGVDVELDVTGFDGNLDANVTNVQGLAQAVDDLTLGTGGGGPTTATEVTVSSDNLVGLLAGSGNVQTAIERLDATGLGAPIFEFTGSYSAQTTNIDEWFNGRSNVHLQSADGQPCARDTFTLPGTQALTMVFDQLAAKGLPETFTMLISRLGCSSTSSIVNSLRVNARSGGPGYAFTGRVPVLNRSDSTTLQISRAEDGTIGSWDEISRGVLTTTSGTTLDDIELQDRSWANLAGTFLPGSDDVLKGYAFRVIASPDNTGAVRSDIDISGDPDRVIYDGDWVVWSADDFTNWTELDKWFVLPANNVRRIQEDESNFLSEVTEQDTANYLRIEDDPAAAVGTEALAWLVDPNHALTSPPFLNPEGIGSNPPDPRFTAGHYTGGRGARQPNGNFVFDLSPFGSNISLFRGEIIIGITGSYVSANDPADMRLEVLERNGDLVHTYNVDANFVDPPAFADLTLDYFILSQYKLGDSFTELNYKSGQQLRLVVNRPNRRFTLSDDVAIQNSNIDGGAWDEDALSTPVRAKLNKETSFSAQDRTRLNAIETHVSSDTVPGTTPIQVRAASPSYNDDHYRTIRVEDGFVQGFQEAITYTIRVANNVEFTGFDHPGGRTASGSVTLTEILPSLFENERTYTLVVPPSPDDITYDPLNHIITLTGTISTNVAVGLAPTVKVDVDNFEQQFLDSIVNHADQQLPAPLTALANQARVFTFDNTDFVSNNDHAGVASMFAFLKNRPDERLGDSAPTDTALTNEITNSIITAEIADTVGLFYPRTIGGSFDDGVDVPTNGALTGPGAVNEAVTITSPSATNFRMVGGFWFTSSDIPENTIRNLLRVKERGSDTFRRLFGLEGFARINSQNLVEQGLLITERVQGAAGTSAVVPVPHHLYTTNGELIHIFSGVGVAEVLFRVNEARAYEIDFALSANGNPEGNDQVNVTIADLNADQDFGQHTLNFTASGHPHSQVVRIEYVANSSTYGGPGHTLRVELVGGLTDNSNFDIDHLAVSAGYTTQETISTPTSYAEANAGGTPLIQSDRLHRMDYSFRQSPSDNNLECIYVITGFDGNNPVVSQSNVVNFGYSPFDLDWTQTRLSNTAMVIQNIQGYFLNTDTPLAQFPTHAELAQYLTSHDDKATDYVWGNASAPSQDVEVVQVVENVILENQIFTSPDGSKWRLAVDNNGNPSYEKVI